MPTKYKGNAAEKRALNAFITLMRCAGSISGRLNVYLKKSDVSGAQFGVLEALFHMGELPQTELARKLLVTGGNITQMVDGLVRKDLVVRERSEKDRRIVTVELTPKGRKLMTKIMPVHVSHIVDEFSVLSAAEQEELKRICKKLGLGKGE